MGAVRGGGVMGAVRGGGVMGAFRGGGVMGAVREGAGEIGRPRGSGGEITEIREIHSSQVKLGEGVN
jgi:hypothetical protein